MKMENMTLRHVPHAGQWEIEIVFCRIMALRRCREQSRWAVMITVALASLLTALRRLLLQSVYISLAR